jgi:hypothetical protein
MSERFYCVAFADTESELQLHLFPSSRVLAVYQAEEGAAKRLNLLIEAVSVRGPQGAIAQAEALAQAGMGLKHAKTLSEAETTLGNWFASSLLERRPSRFDEELPTPGKRSRTSGLGE